jgi:sarcosine oxidase subunit beta
MMEKTADAVVIGGGVHGLSTALHLAKRGMKRVVLLEKKYLGSGATEWSNARVIPQHGTEEMVKVTSRSLEMFQNWDDAIGGGGDPQCLHNGRLWSGAEERAEEMTKAAHNHRAWGARIRFLSPEELGEMWPAEINVDDIALSVLYEDASYCNPMATVSAFATRAKQLGVSLYEDTEATEITVSGGKVRSVDTSQGEIATPVVVNAAGLWSGRVGRMAGIEVPITVTHQEITFFRPPWDFSPEIPQLHDTIYEVVYGPDRSGLINVYDRYQVAQNNVVDPDTYEHEASQERVTMNFKMMVPRFPALVRASYRGGPSGAYDMTPDSAPIIGAVPEVEGFYLNCGWSGDGFMTSPAMGDLMAELITTGRTTSIDLSAFHLGRFAEGKLLEGPWYSPGEDLSQKLMELRQGLSLPSWMGRDQG